MKESMRQRRAGADGRWGALGSLGGVKAGHLLKGRQPGQIGEAEGGSEQKSAITDREDHVFG